MELFVDTERIGACPITHIYVRARLDERWVNADIAALTSDSLLEYLHSRGGCNPWAEQTVALLINHRIDHG